MMELIWQQIIIAGAVGGAAAYLAIRYWRRRRRQTECSGCGLMKLQNRPR